jgi:hypothetical protein
MIDFPPRPTPRVALVEQPAAAPAPESDAIRALVMQGIFEMIERAWW